MTVAPVISKDELDHLTPFARSVWKDMIEQGQAVLSKEKVPV